MSNALAIAAVTSTLRNVISRRVRESADLSGTTVTVRSPERARGASDTANQINIFLFQVIPNAAWRNHALPSQARPGEAGFPPLALNLQYLITPYADEDDFSSFAHHRLLGEAMSALHDAPVLDRRDLEEALPGNDVHLQIEQIKISAHNVSVDDLSKIWSSFQAGYRLSAVYEAQVVLIESRRPTRAAPPVLSRGPGDVGPTAAASGTFTPRTPELLAVAANDGEPALRLGGQIALDGAQLDADAVELRLRSLELEQPLRLGDAQVISRAADRLVMALPAPGDPADPTSAAATWVAGPYLASLKLQRSGQRDVVTKEVRVALAPEVLSINGTSVNPEPANPVAVDRDVATGSITVTLTFRPLLRQRQSAWLVIGDLELPLGPRSADVATVTVTAPGLDPGQYLLRLRVDGVDALVVDRGVRPPRFRAGGRIVVR